MRKAVAVFILLFILLIPAAAQDRDNPEIDDWEDYNDDLYGRGDQSIVISIGTVFPLAFLNNGSLRDMKFSPPVGGAGSLSYNYFLNSHFFVGGEIGVQFLSSIAKDTLFIIPLGVRGGYQFNVWKIDIPLTITVGMVWHRFLSSGYYGLFTKAGVSGYYRATLSWAFGLSVNWYWFPQWTNDSSRNMDGHMLDLTLSARYIF